MTRANASLALVIIHLLIYTVYVCGWYHHLKTSLYAEVPPEWRANGGMWKHLSNWNILFQAVNALLNIFCDFITNESPKTSRLTRIRDSLFNGLCFPLAVFISTGFWFIYLVDRDLVWEPGIELINPPLKNHVMHTLPIVVVLLESFLVDHNRRQERHGLKLLSSLLISYTSYAMFVGYYSDDWFYPYLKQFGHISRLGFVFIHLTLPLIYYYISGILYDIVWPNYK